MQDFTLPYGHGKASFSLADDVPVRVIAGGRPETYVSEVELVRDALERNPIGAPLLWEVVNDTDRVVVAVPDITRKAHANVVVPEVLYALVRYAGVPVSYITLLFTCGSHRALTDEERRYIVGDEAIESGVIIKDHVRESETLPVGKSSTGLPIELSKLAVEADRVILTGAILAHHLAGYSGGRKSVLPGMASHETNRRNHARAITPGKGMDENCWVGILDENPVHTEMMEAAEMLNPDYVINAVPDAQGSLVDVVAGHWREAWLKGVEICKEYTFARVDKPIELAITTSGGYPKDLDFVQFHKAINNTCRAMRDGGVLILLAEGEDGWGNPNLREWCLRRDLGWICSHDTDSFEINMNIAGRFIQNVSRFNVIFVTKLPKEDIEKMGAHHAVTIYEALEKAYSLLGTRTPETTVIENANVIVTQLGK